MLGVLICAFVDLFYGCISWTYRPTFVLLTYYLASTYAVKYNTVIINRGQMNLHCKHFLTVNFNATRTYQPILRCPRGGYWPIVNATWRSQREWHVQAACYNLVKKKHKPFLKFITYKNSLHEVSRLHIFTIYVHTKFHMNISTIWFISYSYQKEDGTELSLQNHWLLGWSINSFQFGFQTGIERIYRLRKVGITGGSRKRHSDEFHNLHSSPDTIRVTKSWKMRQAGI
jgi:hypothetical protein